MFKVIVSPQAWDDFFEIYDYIAAENPDAAARFCDALLNHTELLATFPHIGVLQAKSRQIRSILHTPVRIHYRVSEVKECVEVVHFWHTARRTPKL